MRPQTIIGALTALIVGGIIGFWRGTLLHRELDEVLAVPPGLSFRTGPPEEEHVEGPLARLVIEGDDTEVNITWDCSKNISPLRVIPLAMKMVTAGSQVLFRTLRLAAQSNAQNN